MNWTDWKLRLRALVFRRRIENELDEEVQFHLAMQARKNRMAGSSDTEAVREARVQFGGVQQVKEECRDARRTNGIESLLQDIRYALRGFRRTPGFALTVIATIAIGLGLNTAIFTIFNAYVLRPLSVYDPYSLYQFTWLNRSGNEHGFSWEEFQDFQKQNPAFLEIEGHDRVLARVDGHVLLGNLVTGNHFSMLGVNAALGRTLLPADAAEPGSSPVMVLSHSAWKNKFGSDPAILGKRLLIRGCSLEVVGVAREGYAGLSEIPADFWAPVTMAPQVKGIPLFGPESTERLRIVGRLRPDWSPRQAEAALTTWARQRTAGSADAEKATEAVIRSEASAIPLQPEVIAAFTPLFMAFGLVLLIACANVANMMLGRSMGRQREIGVRLAIGAPRSRLIRQLLTESLLLALPAGILGFFISKVAIESCQRLMLTTIPRGYVDFIRFIPLHPDARVFVFMLAAAAISALLFGLAPAVQATRSNVMEAARGEFLNDFRPARLRNALVIGQVAVSVMLIICAAILLHANNRITRLDIGLKVQGVVSLEVQDQHRAKVIQELSTYPLVRTIAAASKTPMMGLLSRMTIATDRAGNLQAGYLYVSPEYFPVFRIPILQGRNFTADEAKAGDAVAIISQSTARLLWPAGDALGQSFRIEQRPQRPGDLNQYRAGPPPHALARVIGITPDVVSGYVGDGPDRTCFYFPGTAQTAGSVLLVQVEGNAEAARQNLDAALATAVPGAIDQIHTMEEIRTAQGYPFRAIYWISAAIGLLALLLTLSGIYGVLSYLVTQRTKEIGIRVALGASSGRAAGLVLKQSLRLAGLGAGLGAVAALGVSRVLASQIDVSLFDSFDGMAFVMGMGFVLAAAACAAWVPSRRASRIDPMIALRHD